MKSLRRFLLTVARLMTVAILGLYLVAQTGVIALPNFQLFGNEGPLIVFNTNVQNGPPQDDRGESSAKTTPEENPSNPVEAEDCDETMWPTSGVGARRRQYYEAAWSFDENSETYLARYYFLPDVDAEVYRYHIVIYDPSQPQYIYFFSPKEDAYWGRYAIDGRVRYRYSSLDESDRVGSLSAIPESVFPIPGPMPAIPGSKDGTPMIPPTLPIPGDA